MNRKGPWSLEKTEDCKLGKVQVETAQMTSRRSTESFICWLNINLPFLSLMWEWY